MWKMLFKRSYYELRQNTEKIADDSKSESDNAYDVDFWSLNLHPHHVFARTSGTEKTERRWTENNNG